MKIKRECSQKVSLRVIISVFKNKLNAIENMKFDENVEKFVLGT